MNTPCFNCTKRKVGCHAACEEYMTFKKNLEEHNSIMRKGKEVYNESVIYERNRKRRLSQAHGKK